MSSFANANIILVLVALILGCLLRRLRRIPKNAHQVLNVFVIWISLPALVLLHVPSLMTIPLRGSDVLLPVLMPWIQFVLSWIIFYFLGKLFNWSSKCSGTLIIMAGLANTSFVGLPILESLLGTESLKFGILVDQAGSFLVLSTLGILVASIYGGNNKGRDGETFFLKSAVVFKKILRFPPFVSLLVAVVWGGCGSHFDNILLHNVLKKLADTLVPLALVAVGLQLNFSVSAFQRQWKYLLGGLLFRLLVSPLFFLVLYGVLMGYDGLPVRVAILESAMAPMISAAVVCDEFGLDSELASLMLGIGIPISIFSVALWNSILVI